MIKNKIYLALCVILCLSGCGRQSETTNVIFYTETGQFQYTQETARTSQQKQTGLMHRKSIASDAGMIFIYDMPEQVGIWMKDTLIPLDIIFISCQNTVDKIVHAFPPESLNVVYPNDKICFISELQSGQAKKIALKTGDTVTIK